jgi:YebC/PmpR family DNA-binding regulatory protein
MSGHSKWANIKHKKARSDEKRGKEFTKIAKEISIAARMGGTDPDANARLKLMIQKAKFINMPNENIARAIKRGSGDAEGDTLEELFYEGYAPGGVAVMLDIATDNRNRTASDIRHLFSKNGGNLGETGCVGWMFDHVGLITVPKAGLTLETDEVMLLALECGADDLREEEDSYEIVTAMEAMMSVIDALPDSLPVESADLTMQPRNLTEVSDVELARKILKLIDALDDHDDVQNVYVNLSVSDEVMAQLD